MVCSMTGRDDPAVTRAPQAVDGSALFGEMRLPRTWAAGLQRTRMGTVRAKPAGRARGDGVHSGKAREECTAASQLEASQRETGGGQDARSLPQRFPS